MELKKGMYVRIKDKNNNQFIRKIIELPEDTRYGSIVVDKDIHYARWVSKKKVIKASSNIIDLIEEGDYVNGDLVTFISSNPQKNQKGKHRIILNDSYSLFGKYENIKSIVTKEQFESQKYIVESEWLEYGS